MGEMFDHFPLPVVTIIGGYILQNRGILSFSRSRAIFYFQPERKIQRLVAALEVVGVLCADRT